jgi:mRNA interferase RelE/StbE
VEAGGYRILYRPDILSEDLPEIPRNLQRRIVHAIETRLGTDPARYGARLRRSLSPLWKLRVGDYRVVYELEARTVRVWLIAHRKTAYSEAGRRWKA